MKFGMGDSYKILNDFEFRKNWRSDSHTLLRGVNEFLFVLPTFIA
jgi:hypothetical protein